MQEVYENIVDQISAKRDELKERQLQFTIFCERNMDSPLFESGAINALLVMQQLKFEIAQLEKTETLIRAIYKIE